jgi:hypothetical protein
MFTPEQYRAKAAEYGELVRTSTGSDEKREFRTLEQSFSVLADNEQWLADNHQNTLRAPQQDRSNDRMERSMRTHRFDMKIKLPATVAIKHQVRVRMAQYESKAEAEAGAEASRERPREELLAKCT